MKKLYAWQAWTESHHNGDWHNKIVYSETEDTPKMSRYHEWDEINRFPQLDKLIPETPTELVLYEEDK